MRAITGLPGRENLVEKAAGKVRKGRHILVTTRTSVGKGRTASTASLVFDAVLFVHRILRLHASLPGNSHHLPGMGIRWLRGFLPHGRLRGDAKPRGWPGLVPSARHASRTGPGYCATQASVVSKVIPSTIACATRRRSNGSLWRGGKWSRATACSLPTGNSR